METEYEDQQRERSRVHRYADDSVLYSGSVHHNFSSVSVESKTLSRLYLQLNPNQLKSNNICTEEMFVCAILKILLNVSRGQRSTSQRHSAAFQKVPLLCSPLNLKK